MIQQHRVRDLATERWYITILLLRYHLLCCIKVDAMANNNNNKNLLPTFATTAPVIYNRGGAIHISGLSLLHDGGRTLFENANVTLKHGSITALVGTNGAGMLLLSTHMSNHCLSYSYAKILLIFCY